MESCDNCKFWGKYYDSACDRVGMDDSLSSNSDAFIMVSADDDQGLDAYLVTGPKFGCKLFEPRSNSK